MPAGTTTQFGMTRRSRSVADTVTSTAQNVEPMTKSQLQPNFRAQPATSNAVAASTAGYRHGIVALQWRQRPRSTTYETSGMLSYQARGVAQDMHAEPGDTIERCSGSRAATTLRKLPIARAGANASAASSTFIPA